MAVSRAASGFGELLGLDGVGDSLSGVLNEYQPDDVAHHDRLVSVPLTGRNEDAVSGGEADSHAIEIDVQVASEDVADMAALTPVVRPPSLEGTGLSNVTQFPTPGVKQFPTRSRAFLLRFLTSLLKLCVLPRPSHGPVASALHVHVVGAVHEPVEHALGDHRVGEELIPVLR